MDELRDIINKLPKDKQTNEVLYALRVAYYRGAEHHKQNPKEFNIKRIEKMKSDMKNFTKINNYGRTKKK